MSEGGLSTEPASRSSLELRETLSSYPLAADDCWTVDSHATSISGSTANSMPPGSKSLPSGLAYCRNEGALLKLPVLPNCRTGTHWLA